MKPNGDDRVEVTAKIACLCSRMLAGRRRGETRDHARVHCRLHPIPVGIEHFHVKFLTVPTRKFISAAVTTEFE